jgi:hypothetical protein
MVELDDLAGKVFSLLKGNGLQVKIFDDNGAETTNPNEGRRFFVTSPNLMVTIDEEGNQIEFSKGLDVDESVDALQKNIRKLADEFLMNSDIKVFGKQIQPRDYAYQAKMKAVSEGMARPIDNVDKDIISVIAQHIYYPLSKILENIPGLNANELKNRIRDLYKLGFVDVAWISKNKDPEIHLTGKGMGMVMNENTIRPHNHHLLGEVLKKIKYFGKVTAAYLSANMDHPPDLSELQPILNRLVETGKIVARPDKHGQMEYSMAVDEAITESFSKMFGSLKTSQQTLENVRILVKHKVPVNEEVRGSRSRHISAIFLECNGERFRFPHTYLPGARAMAQHLAHGGTMGDKVGSYISESTGNLLKLQSFNRYVTTNKLINEDSSGIVETVKENIETIRSELKKLTGVKTYETVKARLETYEREALAEDDTSGLKDLFTIRRFDEKFEEVLPIVKQLVQEKDTYHKRIEEAAANIVRISSKEINTTPMFEFSSSQARMGFMLNEFSLRIVENEELAGFVNKIGTKLCKEGVVNDFEKAVVAQVLENIQIIEKQGTQGEIKESADLSAFYDKYTMNFF